MLSHEYTLDDIEDTRGVATELAHSLKGGEVILARGELGSGKTTFFRFLGETLGVKKTINSPTFNLIKIYHGDFTFYHADCYRLEGEEEESKEVGLEDVIGDRDVICYIEWPEFASQVVKNHHPQIRLYFSYDDEDRKLVIEDER